MINYNLNIPELASFLEDGLISEVLHIVKSGKEATVYCCRGVLSSTKKSLFAAKVYRTLSHRNFRNDAIYQEGHVILDKRTARAVRNKSRYGRMVKFNSWINKEWEMLLSLYEERVNIPKPIAISGRTILMEYIGDIYNPAPTLRHVLLKKEEANPVFESLMHTVELMLACNCIHSDLSPFNILYWAGNIKIIDFPQAVNPQHNQNAFFLLSRDIDNICRHFSQYGIKADSSQIARGLWSRFLRAEL